MVVKCYITPLYVDHNGWKVLQYSYVWITHHFIKLHCPKTFPIVYPNVFSQVAAPAKKKTVKPKEEDKSETVEPQTWLQKATASLPALLKDAADARTSSIKLRDMEYAKELSDQLLSHAKKLECLYQDMSKAVANPDEKSLKKLRNKSLEMEAFGTKAQARSGIQF